MTDSTVCRKGRHWLGRAPGEFRQAPSTWINAVNAGNLVRLMTLMTDDAGFLHPGQAPVDRAGFSSNFSVAHQQARIHCSSELEEIVVAGDVAYTRSRDGSSVTSRAGDDATRLASYRITVYRKPTDAQWRSARDAHTLAPVERVVS